jgi:hypothetical protein
MQNRLRGVQSTLFGDTSRLGWPKVPKMAGRRLAISGLQNSKTQNTLSLYIMQGQDGALSAVSTAATALKPASSGPRHVCRDY